MVDHMVERLRSRQEWRFFTALHRAAPARNLAWWVLVVTRGIVPAVVSVGFGWLVASIEDGDPLAGPLALTGTMFTLSMVLHPLHQLVSAGLGDRMANHLYDRLLVASLEPDGLGHLERPELTADLTMARDFDLGMMGPPLSVSMDFLANGLVQVVVGIAASTLLFGFAWWAPFVMLGAWGSTHWLLRESAVWRDRNTDEVRRAQRHADYAYRLAVDAAPAKELRLFGLAGWVIERFVGARTTLYDLQFQATRLREKSVLGALAIVSTANVAVFWLIAQQAVDGDRSTGAVVVFVQAAIGVSALAFGGLSWALDGAASPVMALERLEAAVGPAGALAPGRGLDREPGAVELRFRDVAFAYDEGRRVLDGIDLHVPAGSSIAIVGVNGAGKTTLAKLLCRLYDPVSGTIEVDGVPLTDLDPRRWRRHVTAVFQDFVRFELSLRDNVAPDGADDTVIREALAEAGASHLAGGDLDTVLSKGYPDGTDLSGGQWQRIALARALCAVKTGAGLLLLDEPTAQLDVRGEAEIFDRVLSAARDATVVLISHRFSTVRLADRICVVEHGRVVELGTHDELMATGGRYRSMFDLQASRFADGDSASPEYDEDGREVVREHL
ncbi:MAG: ABC transporter ATP-binding protein [Acidimicrobiales bacterium]|nr:ABC transporter ATP-binding protein [Acidimicrobiales bacterium]